MQSQSQAAATINAREYVSFKKARTGGGNTTLKMWKFSQGGWLEYSLWRYDYDTFYQSMAYTDIVQVYEDIVQLLHGAAKQMFTDEWINNPFASNQNLSDILHVLATKFCVNGRSSTKNAERTTP